MQSTSLGSQRGKCEERILQVECSMRFQPLWIYIHIIASSSHRYVLCKVRTTNIPPSPLHTRPFLHAQTYPGVLPKHGAGAMRYDTQWGSKPPHPPVGAFKSLQFQCVRREGLSLLISSVRQPLPYHYGDTALKRTAHFPAQFAPMIFTIQH